MAGKKTRVNNRQDGVGIKAIALIVAGVVGLFLLLIYLSNNFSFLENLASQTRNFKKNDVFLSLASTNEELLEKSYWELEQLGEYAVPRLVKIVEDEDKEEKERLNAIYALGRLGKNGTKALASLVPLLRDDDDDIRGTVVRSVGKIGDASAVFSIEPLLKDKNKWVREGAESALKVIGSRDAKSILLKYHSEK